VERLALRLAIVDVLRQVLIANEKNAEITAPLLASRWQSCQVKGLVSCGEIRRRRAHKKRFSVHFLRFFSQAVPGKKSSHIRGNPVRMFRIIQRPPCPLKTQGHAAFVSTSSSPFLVKISRQQIQKLRSLSSFRTTQNIYVQAKASRRKSSGAFLRWSVGLAGLSCRALRTR